MHRLLSSTDAGAVAAPGHGLPARACAALELVRPANALTAGADALAGLAVAYSVAPGVLEPRMFLLVAAGICLYAGGVALNDVCDERLDRIERPERPIPSGRVSRALGIALSVAFLALGVLFAVLATPLAGVVALVVAALAMSYDAWTKHHALLGPLNMGLCRAGSLLLGLSASAAAFQAWAWLGLLPLAYVAAITVISRGEVDGANRYGWAASAIVILVGAVLAVLGRHADIAALGFVLLFLAAVLPPFVRAARKPSPSAVRAAVKAGVVSIVLFDAALAAVFAGWLYALAVAALFPISRLLARAFAVA